MERLHLQIKFLDVEFKSLYDVKKNYDSDSGFDLAVPRDHTIPGKTLGYKIPLGVACKSKSDWYKRGYYLYPRSSITKTPLRMANSVGIIDSDYRGEIIAVVDNHSNDEYVVTVGSRLFQLCSPDLMAMKVEFVDELDETERGENGFGSTGK